MKHGWLRSLVIIAVIFSFITILGCNKLYFIYQQLPPQPFNYKFIYTQNNKVFIYDLDSDTTQPVNIGFETPNLLEWSMDGKVAFSDRKNNIYILDTISSKTNKVAEMADDFPVFWSTDNSTLFFEQKYNILSRSFLDVDYSPSTPDGHKGYALNINNGTVKTLDRDTYKSLVATSSATIKRQPISYDGRFFIDENRDNLITSYLQDKQTNLQYNLPLDIQIPSISTKNSYIAWTKYIPEEKKSKLYIYKLDDILKGNLSNPIKNISNVEFAGHWAWVDDNNLIFIDYKPRREKEVTIGTTLTYYITDIKTNVTTPIISPNEAPGYSIIYVSPDKKRFVRMVNEGIPGELGSLADRVAIHELPNGKEIRRFQYDAGRWSPPIVSTKKSFLEFSHEYLMSGKIFSKSS